MVESTAKAQVGNLTHKIPFLSYSTDNATPQAPSMDTMTFQKCYLLSLPKELRLEIWKWTLTDPSIPSLTVNVGREKKDPYHFVPRGSGVPRIKTWLQPTINGATNPNILRTNRLIYEEALPILYQSVRFALTDHNGIFPLWLASFSPYAHSQIRCIKLRAPQQVYNVNRFGDPAVPVFHWAVTCAQVATLSTQLKEVEIDGLYLKNLSPKVRRSIIHPLCGIKTPKVFGKDNSGDVHEWMASAEQVVAMKSALRRKQAEARAIKEAERKEREIQDEEVTDGQQTKSTIMQQGYHAFPLRSGRRNREIQWDVDADNNQGRSTVNQDNKQSHQLTIMEQGYRAFPRHSRRKDSEIGQRSHADGEEGGNIGNQDTKSSHQPTIMEQEYRAFPRISRQRIDGNLSATPGIVVSETELAAHTLSIVRTRHESVNDTDTEAASEDWNLVEFEHCEAVPSSPPPSYLSRRNSDAWSNASSAVAEARGLLNDEEVSDTESWDVASVMEESVLLPGT